MATLSMATARLWVSQVLPGVSEPNVEVGNFWLNTNTSTLLMCMNATAGLQVWTPVIGV